MIMDNEKLLLLEQDFMNHKTTSQEKIHALEKQFKELDMRVKDMELSKEKTEYQYEQIIQTLEKLNETTIPNLTKQIQELKNKPVERYNLIITSIVSAVVGGVVTFMLKSIL